MREVKVGTVAFTDEVTANRDPYIIGCFGEDGVGKTRLALTGPDGVGCVPLEMKSYATLDKDSKELGKRILKPKDPTSLIVPKRKVDLMKDNVERQRFYQGHVALVKETVYALLEHPDVRIVVIDKFNTFAIWQEYAINGMMPKTIPIDGVPKTVKAEVRQSIIDFINSLSFYGKPVVLNTATRADYDVVDAKGEPERNTWDCGCLYMFGSHCNLVVELETNPHWNTSKNGAKHQWKYALNVRRCQRNPTLEGPEGNPLLLDDAISLPNLIAAVEPDADMEAWI